MSLQSQDTWVSRVSSCCQDFKATRGALPGSTCLRQIFSPILFHSATLPQLSTRLLPWLRSNDPPAPHQRILYGKDLFPPEDGPADPGRGPGGSPDRRRPRSPPPVIRPGPADSGGRGVTAHTAEPPAVRRRVEDAGADSRQPPLPVPRCVGVGLRVACSSRGCQTMCALPPKCLSVPYEDICCRCISHQLPPPHPRRSPCLSHLFGDGL